MRHREDETSHSGYGIRSSYTTARISDCRRGFGRLSHQRELLDIRLPFPLEKEEQIHLQYEEVDLAH